jgi:hypothetical protein
MATIYWYSSLINGVPPSTTYLTSNDEYLHVWNYGPDPLFANYTTESSPSAPTSGIPVPAGQWVLLPADIYDSGERLAFGYVAGGQPGEPNWLGMHIWVT